MVCSSPFHATGACWAPFNVPLPMITFMKSSPTRLLFAAGLILLGFAFAAGGIYVGETDDAPGAALIGIVVMLGLVALGVKIVRGRA